MYSLLARRLKAKAFERLDDFLGGIEPSPVGFHVEDDRGGVSFHGLFDPAADEVGHGGGNTITDGNDINRWARFSSACWEEDRAEQP